MLPVIVLLGILCLLLPAYLLALLAEVRRLGDSLESLAEDGAEGELYTLTCNRHFRRLAAGINRLLEVQREKERRLRRADEAFKESVTGISHDLRTPLTSVSGYLQLVGSEKTAPQRKAEYIRVIQGRLTALLALLDELFEYTRVESGSIASEPERLNLNNLLMEQLALYYDEFTARGIEPDIRIHGETVTVFCDRKSLERIFQNLVKNAMVHGEGGFSVALDRIDGKARIEFSNAVGGDIDAERLFDRFYTSDRSRSSGGAGLGLAIVRGLASAMGGAAYARREDGLLRLFVDIPLYGKRGGPGERDRRV